MNLQERLAECRKIKTDVEKEEQELLEQIEKERKIEFGDIIEFRDPLFGFRIALFEPKTQQLVAYNKNGIIVGGQYTKIDVNYKKTGKNIFKDNLFNLDS